jgi:iron complex outermembrane receptor protein
LQINKNFANTKALSVQLRWDALSDAASPNKTVDLAKFAHPVLQPSMAAAYSQVLHKNLALDLGAGRSFRAPSFFEQYGAPGAYFCANKNLEPETGVQADVALRWQRHKNQARLGIFVARMNQTILLLNRNAYELRPENTGPLWRSGLEASAELAWSGGFGQSWRAEYLWTRLDVSGRQLPNTPALRFYSRTFWQHKITGWPIRLKSYVQAGARSGSSGNLFGELMMAPQATVDAGLAIKLDESNSVSCQLRNIFDAQSRVDLRQVPLPGRSWRCVLQMGI